MSTGQELSKLREEIEGLVEVTNDHTELSSGLVDCVTDLQARIDSASAFTEAELFQLRLEFTVMKNEVAKAIQQASVVNHIGQVKIAKAIEKHSGDQLTNTVVAGIFGLFGAAVAGRLIGDSIERAKQVPQATGQLPQGRAVGTVKFFNGAKGFGFIIPDGGWKDLFVHASDCMVAIGEGDRVSFSVKETPRGMKAVDVQKS